ncbi:twin-arginine translocase subunit TatC [Halobium salinum]|uniref:Twin-arginine translocase subunit TatC n=1 Tax=Halobium salinum TaxID=1364940 RepID=A0ABD5P9Y2_9EURY|nr:twin-arginine translocase subunit TatC [Halobium salinum]
MAPSTAYDVRLRRARYTPLGATVRDRFGVLLGVWLLTTVVTLLVLVGSGVDLLATAAPLSSSASDVTVVGTDPTDALLFGAEVASLVGGTLALVVATGLAARDDDRVELAAGRSQFLLAAATFVAGVSVGRTFVSTLLRDIHLLDTVGAATVLESGTSGAVVALRALAELGLFVPVAVGVGAALPCFLVGAVRAGLAPRYTSDRMRGFVALALVTFAAVYSPPDLPSLALVAVPPFAGFAVGLAWLEFG